MGGKGGQGQCNGETRNQKKLWAGKVAQVLIIPQLYFLDSFQLSGG